MHGEQPPRKRRRGRVQRSLEAPTWRRPARAPAVSPRRSGVREREGSSSSPAICSPARATSRRRLAVDRCRCPTSCCVLALAGASRRHVALERHLDDHCRAHARDLGQQRGRVGHVLQHVREDSQIVCTVGIWQVRAVIARHGFDLRMRAAIATAASVSPPPQAPAEPACAERAKQRAVAAADLQCALRANGARGRARSRGRPFLLRRARASRSRGRLAASPSNTRLRKVRQLVRGRVGSELASHAHNASRWALGCAHLKFHGRCADDNGEGTDGHPTPPRRGARGAARPI